MYALIAFEFLLRGWRTVLGVTKLGKKMIKIVPAAMQSGIIVGAGIAPLRESVQTGSHFDKTPHHRHLHEHGFFLLFSQSFRVLAERE